MQILITVYAYHVWLFGVVYVVSHVHYLLSASDIAITYTENIIIYYQ